jgi:hypothetical protein
MSKHRSHNAANVPNRGGANDTRGILNPSGCAAPPLNDATIVKTAPEARAAVEMNRHQVPADRVREFYRRRPEFTRTLFYLWASYVRANIVASCFAFYLDSERMSVQWMLWNKADARRFTKEFIEWLGLVRKGFRESVRFLLDPTFDVQRRKHWPAPGATWEGIRRFTEKGKRDESVFISAITPADIEELYYACAKTLTADWFIACPDRAYVDCEHTVGFTSGKPVSIIRIQIGDLSAVHGMPDDGRDCKERPIIPIKELEFAANGWSASFMARCARK